MLRDEIQILSVEDAELLKADKLSKRRKKDSGLYLTIEDGRYTCYDYSERQKWQEYFGNVENAPEGWEKEFDNPLDAIDWLLRD